MTGWQPMLAAAGVYLAIGVVVELWHLAGGGQHRREPTPALPDRRSHAPDREQRLSVLAGAGTATLPGPAVRRARPGSPEAEGVVQAAGTAGVRSRWMSADLLTPAERRFAEVLRQALPSGVAIAPKVRLADIVNPTALQESRTYREDLQPLLGKHLDFVLMDAADWRALAVVELDDRSHLDTKRRRRDAFLEAVLFESGMPILRVRVRKTYEVECVRRALAEVLPVATASLSAPPAADWIPPIVPRRRVPRSSC